MKALVLTTPVTNGGDYLIEKRMVELIESRNSIDSYILKRAGDNLTSEFINKFDVLLTGPGPSYVERVMQNNDLGFLHIIDEIKIPIHFLGSGVYGNCGFDEYIEKQRFSQYSNDIFKRIVAQGGSLGCRDNVSARILKNNGQSGIFITGCPAWYYIPYVDNISISSEVDKTINKIVISDPGLTKNPDEQIIRANQAIDLIGFVKESFPNAKIIFTFNNGINTKYSSVCNNTIKEFLVSEHINFEELTYSADKFELYDDADLHIGFRVHSHIYSLSKRIPSILIEEDVRGYGVNDILGLWHIYSYDKNVILDDVYKPNPTLNEELTRAITECKNNDFKRFRDAFGIMRDTYYGSLEEWFRYVEA